MTQIDGVQTIADVKALLAARDYMHAQLDQAFANFSPIWSSSDQAAFLAWATDWEAQSARYKDARSSAETAITLSDLDPEPASMIPAQGTYDAILTAEKKAYPQDVVSPGDFDDLDARLRTATTQWGGQAPVYPDVPQPVAPEPGSWLLKHLPKLPDIPGPSKWPWWVIPAAMVVGGTIALKNIKDVFRL